MSNMRKALIVLVVTLGCACGKPPRRQYYKESPPPSNDGQGGNPCRDGVMFNGQCFDFNSKKKSWAKARKYCTKDVHGDLPVGIRKRPVYDAILKYAKDKKMRDDIAWVGLQESKIPGVLTWVNYDVLHDKGAWNIYKEWDTSNPIQKGKPIGCIGINLTTGKFGGYDCEEKHLVICELNFQRDEKAIKKINEKIDSFNKEIELAEQGAFSTLMEANKGVANLYDTDMKLDEEQQALVEAGADPGTATKAIKIKRGTKPSLKDLDKVYEKKKDNRRKSPTPEKVKGNRKEGFKSRDKRAARDGDSYRWPNGIVPFVFDAYVSAYEKDRINSALSVYGEKTCIKLTPRTNEGDYLSIKTSDDGCWSYVGRKGGKQDLNLNRNSCLAKDGTIQHELLHSFGYWHEHTRPDRDSWVTINMDNVEPDYQNNFEKQPNSHINGFDYDYSSIMQYPKWAFAIDEAIDTIIPNRKTTAVLGQRDKITDLDLAELNYLYGCEGGAFKATLNSVNWNFVADRTSGGNAKNAPCAFPFIAGGVKRNECLDYTGGLKWCGTTENYDTDKQWGECVYNKQITTLKGSGNAQGADCVFPFIYKAETFHFCTRTAGSAPWCATTADYDTDQKFGHCVLVLTDGGYTEWSAWGSCSKTCGGGQETRTRECTNPKPTNGGKECEGSSTDQRTCAPETCPISEAQYEWIGCWDDAGLPELMNTIEGTEPATGDYTKRTDKKATCATAAEAAGCKIFALRFDGKCYGQSPAQWGVLYQGNGASADCPATGHGATDAVDAYTLEVNSPINGEWGVWSSYGACSMTCGGGTKKRTRQCKNPAPKNGGNTCHGNSEESKSCADGQCPVNGDWEEWSIWSTDVQADDNSGTKYQYRTRQCANPPPTNGGAQCQGDAVDVKPIG
ncbi:uncharacterized protein LOC135499675 isoform X2 [Lineus longissimus]|uniref:uncharacterized protein LOC135499675 isoform X2 n=1 Tax=Lineus longissimus TaxID=88925 RepID=UPI002B4FB098